MNEYKPLFLQNNENLFNQLNNAINTKDIAVFNSTIKDLVSLASSYEHLYDIYCNCLLNKNFRKIREFNIIVDSEFKKSQFYNDFITKNDSGLDENHLQFYRKKINQMLIKTKKNQTITLVILILFDIFCGIGMLVDSYFIAWFIVLTIFIIKISSNISKISKEIKKNK